MPDRINWQQVVRECRAEVAALEERGEDVDSSRDYRRAVQNLRSAERHLEVEQEKQAERERYDRMTPSEVAREVVDRAMNGQ